MRCALLLVGGQQAAELFRDLLLQPGRQLPFDPGEVVAQLGQVALQVAGFQFSPRRAGDDPCLAWLAAGHWPDAAG